MLFRISLLLFIIGLLFSCRNSLKKKEVQLAQIENKTKRELYQSKMILKDFSLSINGSCDDALEDTLHNRFVAYTETVNLSDSMATIEFKFKDACCQDFLGDYNISNDTLNFYFEQVNEEMCTCICWYRYKLVINNIKEKFTEINIIGIR